jgi:hypothetical protein
MVSWGVPEEKKKKTRPRDPSQLAKEIVDIATGQADDEISGDKKDPQNRKGRAGGKKGGRARALRLTAVERSEIARVAANARWKKES